MTGPLIPCGRPECRLCNRRPVDEPRGESLPELLVGGAIIVLLFAVVFILWPVLVA